MTAYATIAELRAYLDQVPALTAQTVTLSGATGGTFPLSYGDVATSALAYNASAATVQAALVALNTIGAGKAKVGGPAGGPWEIVLAADLAASAMPFTASAGSLTGSSPTITIESTTDALLQDCLDRARDIVDTALGFSFFDAGASWPTASVKKVSAEESVWLRLLPYQEGSITLITVVGDTEPIADYEEDWDAGRFHLWREDGWAGQRYAMTAKYGYGPAPDAIVQLNLELAVNLWRARAKGMFAEILGAEGGGYVRFIGGLTKQQQMIVAGVQRRYADPVY